MKSIRIWNVLALIGLCSVGLAALSQPSTAWAVVLSILLMIVLAGVLATAILARGDGRAYWVGSAVFGWAGFALVTGPWASPAYAPKAFLDRLADDLFARLGYLDPDATIMRGHIITGPGFDLKGPAYTAISGRLRAFHSICGDLLCLAFSMVAGLISSAVAGRHRARTPGN